MKSAISITLSLIVASHASAAEKLGSSSLKKNLRGQYRIKQTNDFMKSIVDDGEYAEFWERELGRQSCTKKKSKGKLNEKSGSKDSDDEDSRKGRKGRKGRRKRSRSRS
uniref:Uncharacterized protein n=1 Tax=Trieres chinensis TaxID=1514140 RepID=A0A7S2E9W5_TRICV